MLTLPQFVPLEKLGVQPELFDSLALQLNTYQQQKNPLTSDDLLRCCDMLKSLQTTTKHLLNARHQHRYGWFAKLFSIAKTLTNTPTLETFLKTLNDEVELINEQLTRQLKQHRPIKITIQQVRTDFSNTDDELIDSIAEPFYPNTHEDHYAFALDNVDENTYANVRLSPYKQKLPLARRVQLLQAVFSLLTPHTQNEHRATYLTLLEAKSKTQRYTIALWDNTFVVLPPHSPISLTEKPLKPRWLFFDQHFAHAFLKQHSPIFLKIAQLEEQESCTIQELQECDEQIIKLQNFIQDAGTRTVGSWFSNRNGFLAQFQAIFQQQRAALLNKKLAWLKETRHQQLELQKKFYPRSHQQLMKDPKTNYLQLEQLSSALKQSITQELSQNTDNITPTERQKIAQTLAEDFPKERISCLQKQAQQSYEQFKKRLLDDKCLFSGDTRWPAYRALLAIERALEQPRLLDMLSNDTEILFQFPCEGTHDKASFLKHLAKLLTQEPRFSSFTSNWTFISSHQPELTQQIIRQENNTLDELLAAPTPHSIKNALDWLIELRGASQNTSQKTHYDGLVQKIFVSARERYLSDPLLASNFDIPKKFLDKLPSTTSKASLLFLIDKIVSRGDDIVDGQAIVDAIKEVAADHDLVLSEELKTVIQLRLLNPITLQSVCDTLIEKHQKLGTKDGLPVFRDLYKQFIPLNTTAVLPMTSSYPRLFNFKKAPEQEQQNLTPASTVISATPF